MFCLENYKIH